MDNDHPNDDHERQEHPTRPPIVGAGLQPGSSPLRTFDFELRRVGDQIRQTIDAMYSELAEQVRQLRGLTPQFGRLFERIEARAPIDRETVRSLLARGWYISGEFDLSTLGVLGKYFEQKDVSAVDAFMVDAVSSRLAEIQVQACQRYPARAEVIQQAFRAYGLGMHSLVVPALLAQLGGMAFEDFAVSLYGKRRKSKEPMTKEKVEDWANSPLSVVLYLPLLEVSGMNASHEDRPTWPEAINRHEIMHGKVSDYGSELNSCKVISLLDYYVSVIAVKAGPQP